MSEYDNGYNNYYNNGSQEYHGEPTYTEAPRKRRNPMATAAIVLGIVSIAFCSVFYIAIPCGAIAIICALLSRNRHPMAGRSKAAIVCGIAGLVLSVGITASALYYVIGTEEGRSFLQYYYEYYSGDSSFDVDEALDELLPFLPGSSDGSSSDEEAQPKEAVPAPDQPDDFYSGEGGFI